MRVVPPFRTALLVLGLLTGGCLSSTASPSGTTHETSARRAGCEAVRGQPLTREAPIEGVLLQEGGSDRPRVEAFLYPHPDYEGNPWSQWGQGLVLEDGRFLSAIGDHLGADGNAYLYEYRPGSGLGLLGNVQAWLEGGAGDWGYGKVHGQMVAGPCDDVYFSTYWGKQPDGGSGFLGDLLFRLDPQELVIENLGVLVEEHGVPSLSGWPSGGLLFGEAVEPGTEPKEGPFFVYDVGSEEVVVRSGEEVPHEGFRNVAVDGKGRAYFSAGHGELWVYDPASNGLQRHPELLPGDWLRASTTPGPDGTVYGATRDPDMLFALEPDGAVRSFGPARGYVASMALHPDGTEFFYVPEAHGKSWRQGTPLVAVDTASGEETVVVELNPLAEGELGLRLGGTYNVAVDSAGETVFVGLNAGGPSDDAPFGEVVLVVVRLP
ncbi:MAG: hypothetical protein ACRD02_08580 [Acidimicrobiia bacterium]